MKKLFLAISVLLSSAFSHAQDMFDEGSYLQTMGIYSFSDPFPDTYGNYNFYSDSTGELKAKEVHLKNYLCEEQYYNKKGKTRKIYTTEKTFAPSGRSKSNNERVFNIKKNETKLKDNKLYEFDKNDNVLKYESWRQGGTKLSFRAVYTYNDQGKKSQYIYYKGKKIKYKGRTIYDYFDDGKMSKITYLRRREWKPRVTSFECSSEGKNLTIRKDTTTVCVNTEYDANGNRISISTRTDDKGHEYKMISRYNSKNQLIGYENVNKKGIFTYGFEQSYNADGKVIESKEYRRNKKLRSTTNYNYNGNNLMESIVIRKDGAKKRQHRRYTYEYDADGYKTKQCSYRKGTELRSTKKFTYNDKHLFEKIETYRADNTLRSTIKYKIEYYQ